MTVTADRTFDLETLLRRTKYSVASAARRAGVDRAQLHRYANLGMSQDEAEDLTAALGTDPGAVWDHWPADSPAPARAAATEPKAPKSDTPPPDRLGGPASAQDRATSRGHLRHPGSRAEGQPREVGTDQGVLEPQDRLLGRESDPKRQHEGGSGLRDEDGQRRRHRGPVRPLHRAGI